MIPTITHPSCAGAADGVISVQFSDNRNNYPTITWWDGSVTSGSYGYLTKTKSGLKAGIYKIKYQPLFSYDFDEATFTIELKDPPKIAISESHNRISCRTPLAGYIDLSVQGGSPPYTYKWKDGPITEDRTQVHAGTYKAVVTDSKGCKDSTLITTYSFNVNGRIIDMDTCSPIENIFGPDTTFSIDDTGPCVTIGIDIGPTYCYSWQPAGAFDDPHKPIQYVCPQPGQSYQLCISTPDSTIKCTTFSMCNVPINLTDTMPTICAPNTKIKLDVSQTFTDYKWYDSNGTLLRSGPTADTVTVTKSGKYTVKVVDDIKCKGSKDFYVKEHCGLMCNNISVTSAPNQFDIQAFIDQAATTFGITAHLYITAGQIAAPLQGQTGNRRLPTYDNPDEVKNLFATQSFPYQLGVWIEYDDATKKICYSFKYNKTYENNLRSKLDGDFNEYLAYLENTTLSYFNNKDNNSFSDNSKKIATSGVLSFGGLGSIVDHLKVPCSFYNDCDQSCFVWWFTPWMKKLCPPMMAGMVDESIVQVIDIANAAKSITLGTIKFATSEQYRDQKWKEIKDLVGKIDEALPPNFNQMVTNPIGLSLFVLSGLQLTTPLFNERYATYKLINSTNPCDAIRGGYQLGRDIVAVGVNFVPLGGLSKIKSFSRVQLLLSKFYLLGSKIQKWSAYSYFQEFINFLIKAPGDVFDYLRALNRPLGWEVLRQFPELRKEKALLEALQLHLNGKTEEYIYKVKMLLNEAGNDKSIRKVINALTTNEGRIFKIINTDIGSALRASINHIRKIIFEPKGSGYQFRGCHSKSAIDELGINARIEITRAKNAEGIYEAKVFAKGPDGIEIQKSGNGGKSTFFPDGWEETRILDEVEYAVKNNRGYDPIKRTYFGFSRDLRIRIDFYYDETTGRIDSYFPSFD